MTFDDIFFCYCLSLLPQLACIILTTTYKEISSALESRELRESQIGPVTAGSASNFDLAFFRRRPSVCLNSAMHILRNRVTSKGADSTTRGRPLSLSSVERGEFSVIAREPRGEHAMWRELCAVQPFSEICLTIVGTTG